MKLSRIRIGDTGNLSISFEVFFSGIVPGSYSWVPPRISFGILAGIVTGVLPGIPLEISIEVSYGNPSFRYPFNFFYEFLLANIHLVFGIWYSPRNSVGDL